jgi:predicted NAD-dependent protein-ADP-ribosyltransferase YbiA (DUF1768 family)
MENIEFRDYLEGELVINFWSNSQFPYCYLSNFAFILDGIEYDGLTYYSVEHAYQAQHYIKEQRVRFSKDGDLGLWDGFSLVCDDENYKVKYNYWEKKGNIGIIAKMATNKINEKKLGLIKDEKYISSDKLWIDLLTRKYSIDYFGEILKKTDDFYLLEYSSRASRKRWTFWNGKIVDNKLVGNNYVGKMLMLIRNKL